MAKNKNVEMKTAQDLKVFDNLYQVKEFQMIEHLKRQPLGSLSLNNIKYFAVETERVTEIASNENEDGLVINGRKDLELSLKPNLHPKDEDILVDERQAVAATIGRIAKEKKKISDLIKMAEDIQDGLVDNEKIYLKRAEALEMDVQVIERETGKSLASTEDIEVIEDNTDDEDSATKKD